jgi:hypothetical protein
VGRLFYQFFFYHVDPSDEDEQGGSFGNAFADLERNFKWKMDKASSWRADWTNAAILSGQINGLKHHRF